MISLSIKDIKQFMTKLLIKETFDEWCLLEAVIVTSTTVTIDGKLNLDFYSDEELTHLKNLRYCYWSNIKGFVFNLIKGKKIPQAMKITFVLPEDITRTLIDDNNIDINPDDINGLFVNIRFHNDLLSVTTASSIRSFSLDKTLDNKFEDYVRNYLSEAEIPFEE